MPRAEEDDSLPGQDSFIDVICNMVGILIVFVVIVGMRCSDVDPAELAKALAKQGKTPVEATAAARPPQHDPALQAEFEKTIRALEEQDRQIKTALFQAVDLRQQSQLIDARRQQLSVVRAAVEQDIAARRAQLDGEDQEKFDVQRHITEAQIKLNELTQEQISLTSTASEVEEIECVPTPLARATNGPRIHVRLKHGQLSIVPVEELRDEILSRGADYLRNGLRQRSEAVDTYGPIGGFRMRFAIERYEEPPPAGAPATAQTRSVIVETCVFLPNADDVGQPIEQALLPDSQFMQALRVRRNGAPEVLAWVYPDSTAALRTLKKALWELATPLAARAMQDGQPIVLSSAGTRSAAQ